MDTEKKTLGKIARDVWWSGNASVDEAWQAAAASVRDAVLAELSPGLRSVMERLKADANTGFDDGLDASLLICARQHLEDGATDKWLVYAASAIVRELDRRHRAAEKAKAEAEAKAAPDLYAVLSADVECFAGPAVPFLRAIADARELNMHAARDLRKLANAIEAAMLKARAK